MSYLDEQIAPVHGLIMPGGFPMGGRDADEAMARRAAQHVHACHDLLRRHGGEVFLSLPPGRTALPGCENLTALPDKFVNMGPLGGILTAMDSNPDVAWIVVASDLPLVDEPTIAFLFQQRRPHGHATAFRNPNDGIPEALCAIYEPSCLTHFLAQLERGAATLQDVLLSSDVVLVDPPYAPQPPEGGGPEADRNLLWWIKGRPGRGQL